jgi:hypothetical protein
MQAEPEGSGGLPASRDHKVGFMSRRRRLRNRWNIHMRKDERAQAKALNRDAAPVATPDGESAAARPARQASK